MDKKKILIAEDEPHIARLIVFKLEREGYEVRWAKDGGEALGFFDDFLPDLVLLDVMMPVMDGHTICRRIREFSQIPIIMVTAKEKEDDKVEGLDVGADDYVTKPFSAQELVARVRAALRRSMLWEKPPPAAFRRGDLVVDFARHRVSLSDQEVKLTATEYRILVYLARNTGRVLTPERILATVWGENYASDTHILQVNITRLRHKLNDDAKNPKYIFTKPGIGYMMKT